MFMTERIKTAPQEAQQPTSELAVESLASTILEVEENIRKIGSSNLIPFLQRHSVQNQLSLSPDMHVQERERIIQQQHDIVDFSLTSSQSPFGATRKIITSARELEWEDKVGNLRTRLSRVSDLLAVAENFYIGHQGYPLQLFTELWIGDKKEEDEFLKKFNGRYLLD
jgi:hypothetical protein